MKLEVVQITKKQYEQYKRGEKIEEIENCFSSILNSLSEDLKKEANEKGFVLEENGISMEILTLHVVVPKASKELKYAIGNEFIFCYLD